MVELKRIRGALIAEREAARLVALEAAPQLGAARLGELLEAIEWVCKHPIIRPPSGWILRFVVAEVRRAVLASPLPSC